MQANRNIHLCQEQAPICKLSRGKAPKHSILVVTDIRQKPVDFFNNTARASTLALAIIFKIQVPSQKFPFLLRYTIPCIYKGSLPELSPLWVDNFYCAVALWVDNSTKTNSLNAVAIVISVETQTNSAKNQTDFRAESPSTSIIYTLCCQ